MPPCAVQQRWNRGSIALVGAAARAPRPRRARIGGARCDRRRGPASRARTSTPTGPPRDTATSGRRPDREKLNSGRVPTSEGLPWGPGRRARLSGVAPHVGARIAPQRPRARRPGRGRGAPARRRSRRARACLEGNSPRTAASRPSARSVPAGASITACAAGAAAAEAARGAAARPPRRAAARRNRGRAATPRTPRRWRSACPTCGRGAQPGISRPRPAGIASQVPPVPGAGWAQRLGDPSATAIPPRASTTRRTRESKPPHFKVRAERPENDRGRAKHLSGASREGRSRP